MCEILIAAGIVIVVVGVTVAAFYFTGQPVKVDPYAAELANIKKTLNSHYDSSNDYGLYRHVCLRSLEQRLKTLETDTYNLQRACEDKMGRLTVIQEPLRVTCRFVKQARRK